SANIKHRKDRQDSARSQLFLKVRRKIENIIREEHEVNEKSLSVARENKFPKEKVYQIWDKIKSGAEKNHSERAFYQAPFDIFIYLEGDNTNIESESQELKLKKAEEKTFWKALVYQKLFEEEAINYWAELEKKLTGNKFYDNVEK